MSEPIQINDGSPTLLNFFSRGGKPPLPIKPRKSKKSPIKPPRMRPPKTRTLLGKPVTKKKKNVSSESLRKVAQKKTLGAMATPPQKRRRWNGSVSTPCIIFWMYAMT